MAETPIVIVGAGPAGLALGLALARFKVHSVILEKDKEITTDPRGVYLTGDAIRILHDLGISDEMPQIGHVVHDINFHQSSFCNKPFLSLSIGSALEQSLPEGVLQMQPRLESALRKKIQQSEYCTVRAGCTVTGLINEDPPVIEYINENGALCELKGQWLIGADGKVGIVRKYFLEPVTNIKQEVGIYPYDGTWVAANLRISLPTSKTHPEFSLWKFGYKPEDVYDLYWPKGWHFCSPPGKPTATGRFGPYEERLWRHEFRQDDWTDSMDANTLLWEHIMPMITRDQDATGFKFGSDIPYPADCIEILRCRPFRFTHKVVNKWFYKKTILIGDAAHVFPPFAGQGIASGVRDAHQLAWRLALLNSMLGDGQANTALEERILQTWANERRKSVDDAARFSMMNGRLCNNQPSHWLLAMLWAKSTVEKLFFLPTIKMSDPLYRLERQGFTTVPDGFLLADFGGGARLSQVSVQSSSKEVLLSDDLLHRSRGIFTVMAILRNGDDVQHLYQDARTAVHNVSLHPSVLSEDSIVILDVRSGVSSKSMAIHDTWEHQSKVFSVAQSYTDFTDDQVEVYTSRLGLATKFAVVRPDLFVFGSARDVMSLFSILEELKKRTFAG